MNNIQRAAFAHLTDESGSGQRGTALHILTERGFFTNLTEDETKQHIHQFVAEFGPNGTGDFCDDGIGRFLDAIGVENPAADSRIDRAAWLSLRFDVVRENSTVTIGEVVQKITAVAALVQGEGWRLENVENEDWGD